MTTVGAILGEPIQLRQILRRELDTILLGLLSLMVDATVAGMNVEKTAGDRRGDNSAAGINLLFETALAAPAADLFPLLGFLLIFIQIHFFFLIRSCLVIPRNPNRSRSGSLPDRQASKSASSRVRHGGYISVALLTPPFSRKCDQHFPALRR